VAVVAATVGWIVFLDLDWLFSIGYSQMVPHVSNNAVDVDTAEAPRRSEDVSPFFRGILIGLGPALLCWIGTVGMAQIALRYFR
jgi:hypothetical protein